MASDFYKQLKKLIIHHEGVRLAPYRCPAGKYTIGVGRNLTDNGISSQEANYMLYNDLCRVSAELDNNLDCMRVLSQQRQMAMIDMCFALGLPRFLGFKKMIGALNGGDYELAAAELLDSKWARQVGDKPGQRAHTLAEMVRTG